MRSESEEGLIGLMVFEVLLYFQEDAYDCRSKNFDMENEQFDILSVNEGCTKQFCRSYI